MPRPVFLESYQNYLLLEFGVHGYLGVNTYLHRVLCAHRSLILSLSPCEPISWSWTNKYDMVGIFFRIICSSEALIPALYRTEQTLSIWRVYPLYDEK
jgi:hypothetical protein